MPKGRRVSCRVAVAVDETAVRRPDKGRLATYRQQIDRSVVVRHCVCESPKSFRQADELAQKARVRENMVE